MSTKPCFSPLDLDQNSATQTNKSASRQSMFRNITKTRLCNVHKYFRDAKVENFQEKKFDAFLIVAQNTDYGYMLEPPWRGGSNKYPQSMFWINNKKYSIPL